MKLGTKNIKILAYNEEVYIDLLNGTIKNFNIPDGVTEIKSYLFYNCTALTSVTIPNSVTTIGPSSFENCTALKSITIPNSVTDMQRGSFRSSGLESITIPDSLTNISGGSFQNCASLKSATLSNSLRALNSLLFADCTSLTSIIIPNSVTIIDWSVFSNCTSLSSVTIPNSVRSIDSTAFENCTALKSITIPKSVNTISSTAFEGCTNLTSITVEDKSEGEISDAPWGATNATVTWTGGAKLIINTTPADATVTFSTGKVSGHQTIVKKGTVVTYTVSKNGYYSTSGTVTVNSNQTLNVSLEQKYYNDGQTIYESASGGASTTLNVKTSGRYQVICIAGGGGASEWYEHVLGIIHRGSSGGSGSGFNCVFRLTKGNYDIQVGKGGAGKLGTSPQGKVSDGGNSRFGNSYAYGGGGGNLQPGPVLTAGAAGAAPKLSYTVISSTLNRAGNKGNTSTDRYNPATGGASIYGSYGKGGDCRNNASVVNGTAGYVKVIFLGR